MSNMDPVAVYRHGTPLRANSAAHKEDVKAIRNASHRMDRATRLVTQRSQEKIMGKIEKMMEDLQGKKSRRVYNQTAATQIEHLQDHPLDPITQVPLWHDLIRTTAGGAAVTREVFMKTALAILSQVSLYTPEAAYLPPSARKIKQ